MTLVQLVQLVHILGKDIAHVRKVRACVALADLENQLLRSVKSDVGIAFFIGDSRNLPSSVN